jgi:aminopeptidase-like protein
MRSPTDLRPEPGHELYELAAELYPVCRSITGEGLRRTLKRIGELVPLGLYEVPSGTQVLDWTVPAEWNIRDAWIATTDGRRVIDFSASNLHVVSYSRPVRGRVSRQALQAHLHSLPAHPDWIPYRTSYYADTWGFCVTERQRAALQEAEYDVCIDATLEPGHLTYGEVLLSGETSDEVLLSAHVCHPSLANDNLSGIATLVGVIRRLAQRRRRYTYRVLFAPGTIGALTWLAAHEADVHRIRHGLVVSCLGDNGPFTYKRSRRDDAEIDRAVEHVLRHAAPTHSVRRFSPDGYDERQYCSPGFNLPVGRLTRTPNGEYPEYHTSADNLDLISPESLAESVDILTAILEVVDANVTLVNQNPKGEPQLGRRGLYRSLGGIADSSGVEQAIRWVLNLSDGRHTLLDIAERSALPFSLVRTAAGILCDHGLLAAPDQQVGSLPCPTPSSV